MKPEQSYIFSHTNELYTGQILAGSCIDLDPVADLYEQRYAYNSAGLYSCRLACTGCCIALKARLCICDLQLYKKRRLYREYVAVVGADLADLVFLNEL